MDKMYKTLFAIIGVVAALAAIALVVKKFLCKGKQCKCCGDTVEDFVEEAAEKAGDAAEAVEEKAEEVVEDAKDAAEEKAEAIAEEFKDYADVELPKEE